MIQVLVYSEWCLSWHAHEQNLSMGTEISRKWYLTGGVPDTSSQMACWVKGSGLSKAELGERFAQICVCLSVGGWHWVCRSCSYTLAAGWQWQPLLQEQRAGQHIGRVLFLQALRSGPSRSLLEISTWSVINKTAEMNLCYGNSSDTIGSLGFFRAANVEEEEQMVTQMWPSSYLLHSHQ